MSMENGTNNDKNINTSPQICKRFKTIYNSMLSLREHNNTMKQQICSLLGKTDINTVSAAEIKSSNKLGKQVLSEHILKSIKLSDALCAPKSVESLSVNSNSNSLDLDSIQKVVSKTVSDTIDNGQFDQIKQQLASLQTKLNSLAAVDGNTSSTAEISPESETKPNIGCNTPATRCVAPSAGVLLPYTPLHHVKVH